MFKTRLLSGIVLVLLAILTVGAGGWVLFATLLILSLIGANELYRAMKVSGKTVNGLCLAGFAGIILYYAGMAVPVPNAPGDSMAVPEGGFSFMMLILALVLLMFVYVFAYPKYHAHQVTAAFLGIVYVAVMLSFVYLTRMLPGGQFHVWLIFLCSWGCDTCAYCAGMLFGKHKMAPVLSPKKSVEGAVGGVAGAALLGFLFQLATDGASYEYAVICAAGALISMVGDLAASAIKRNMEIKDYGTLIPGHGGILDRFDSVIFTAPVIYYLSVFLLGGI